MFKQMLAYVVRRGLELRGVLFRSLADAAGACRGRAPIARPGGRWRNPWGMAPQSWQAYAVRLFPVPQAGKRPPMTQYRLRACGRLRARPGRGPKIAG